MKLKKELTFLDVFCIATGAMISSGIFILPGLAFSHTGPSVCISYLLAGLLAIIGIMSVIELSTAMPKAGGDYYFINRSFGPLVGTISGFLGWLALSLKSAFAIFGIAEIIFLVTGINVVISSIALCLCFVFLNIRGVKEAARFQVILVLGLLILMGLYIVFGLTKINISRFVPFAPQGLQAIEISLSFLLISVGFYYLYGKKRYKGEYALLHLIERITAKELTSRSLETELKAVIQERDDITKDTFDNIVEKSIVLDIDGPILVDGLFRRISDILEQRINISASIIYNLLSEREKKTSSVIGHGIAIPHIIVDGENLFELLLVRCKNSVKFSDTSQNIRTIFVLIGTRDKRNFHLRALAAIAQICQNPKFLNRWLSAKNEESLRDVVLMGKRMR